MILATDIPTQAQLERLSHAPPPTGSSTPCSSTSTRPSRCVEEIARRVWPNGGKVLAVRRGDIPGKGSVAAILRYAP